ncbi:hypothetical protein JW868_04470 [Candidatus Woesearchaeota archaeon]|nr:hypothetical protein [Candidatus Woesearchaeota archaeon]
MSEKAVEKKLTALESFDGGQVDGIVSDYVEFLNLARTPEQVVDLVSHGVEDERIVTWHPGLQYNQVDKGFLMADPDRRQFALVRYGSCSAKEGITMVAAHNDAPCLHLKARPLREGPSEGMILATKPYGGIQAWQWPGSQVRMIGFIPRGPYEVEQVSLEGIIADKTIHITKERLDEPVKKAIPHESLTVLTGFPSRERLLDELRASDLGDAFFERGQWYVVPQADAKRYGNLIAGYGHDDRVCVWAAVNAALKANPHHPIIVYGCNREEIGSTGSDGAISPFFDSAVYALLAAEGMDPKNMTPAILNPIYSRSRMISGDVDVALTDADKGGQDDKSAARFNGGISIVRANGGQFQAGGHSAPLFFLNELTRLWDRAGVMHQMSELPTKTEAGGGGTIARYFAERGIPVIDAGVPCGNMHGQLPYIHVGDLAHLEKGYVVFMERE